MDPNIETFIGCDSSFEKARIVLFGAPFDSTTSFRPGARFGPSAMRHESFGLETYSPYQDKDLTDYRIFDSGDLELCFGSTELALLDIESRAEEILAAGKLPVLLGGEHLVTLGALEAVADNHPDLHVIHFDAHTDLRTEYLGEELSHSTVLYHAWKLLGDGRIHQFGIRSGEKYEFEFAREHTHLHKFDLKGFAETVQRLQDKPVYFTLDLDVLDPSIFCGTGTPEAGGITFKELMEAILLLHKLDIVGCDINELSPHYDHSGTSTAVACKVTREILLQLLHNH